MEHRDFVVVGAGVTGLAFANFVRAEVTERGRPPPSLTILEATSAPGGYCKTVLSDGFVWDYSGHFFHFRHPEIEAWLRQRMAGQDIRTVVKRSFIRFAGRDIDFPFQKNIHQLPRKDFIDCLVDLYFREDGAAGQASFRDMLYARFGRGIADKFLIPYNEKLYATDLGRLDPGAMGRFFPHADIADIIRNMRVADGASYNATFTYPRGGAIEYIRALEHDLPADAVSVNEPVTAIDLRARVATTPSRQIAYRHLISSAPLPSLLTMTGLDHDAAALSSNKVLVFNLGFDKKGPAEPHWLYFPDPAIRFYRVGFYDNIMADDRMSLYVEIGMASDAVIDVDAERARVMADLAREGIVRDHELVSWHHVVLDPAYVHITERSVAETARVRRTLAAAGVHTAGRYGGWTYCSIEDNIVEARELARILAEVT